MFKVVVLPEPDGPRNVTNSPRPIVRCSRLTAWKSPYTFSTSMNSTNASSPFLSFLEDLAARLAIARSAFWPSAPPARPPSGPLYDGEAMLGPPGPVRADEFCVVETIVAPRDRVGDFAVDISII